jgi:hypothetical protein
VASDILHGILLARLSTICNKRFTGWGQPHSFIYSSVAYSLATPIIRSLQYIVSLLSYSMHCIRTPHTADCVLARERLL